MTTEENHGGSVVDLSAEDHALPAAIGPGMELKGRYRVLEEIGSGGQSRVFRGETVDTRELVAIKAWSWVCRALGEQERWEREVRALEALGEPPSVVYILDWGFSSGGAYLILEYSGRNLAKLIDEYSLGMPVPLSLQMASQVAEALCFAHEKGILHRDVKPNNLLLSGDSGGVKLVDFGLVRFEGDSPLIRPGHSMGTPGFTAPEQMVGAEPGPRWDVYGLGISLAAMLTGNNSPDRSAILSEVSARLNEEVQYAAVLDVIKRAIEWDPSERFQTMREFAQELHRLLQGQGESNMAPSKLPPAAPSLPPDTLPHLVSQYEERAIAGLQTFLLEYDEYSVLHVRRSGQAPLLEPRHLQGFRFPERLLFRRNLGLVLSGPLPVWFFAYLSMEAHAFSWVGTYDPRLNGAVVVKRLVGTAPPLGTLVSLKNPDISITETGPTAKNVPI